jgi:RsiW-degrading membrane proteinase PrsW (M82 family)
MAIDRIGVPDKRKAIAWLKLLLIGTLLYFASLVILVITGNTNLFPTVVLIGNFLVPVAYVAFFYERRHFSQLSMPTTAFTFFYGGVLGVLASSILEPIFIRSMDPGSLLLIGLIEESAKILGVLVLTTRLQHNSEMDGLVLGAAAGMGFAALESMGYTFTAFLTSGGSLTATVFVTMLRGILSPVGHGTWTAILASVLFRESAQNRFRLNGKVIIAFLSVALLHALWDGLPAFVTAVFSAGFDVFLAQSLVGGIGFLVLFLRWRDARRLQIAEQNQPENPTVLEEAIPEEQQ